jgi:hypothetical protein
MLRTLPQRRLLYAAGSIMTVIALIGLVLFNQQAAASEPQIMTLSLEPGRSIKAGEAITVKLVATGARNLAGFQARVEFDANKLRLVDASAETELKKSGRDLLALEPVVREGAVSIAAATCPVKNCHDTRPKRAQRITRGVDGRVVLGTFEFYTEQPGQYTLTLDGVKLVDPNGQLLAVTTADAVLDVSAQ